MESYQRSIGNPKLMGPEPRSYREFLLTSNGWGPVSFFVERMLPVDEITWYRDSDRDLIEAWIDGEGGSDQPDVPDADYFVYGAGQDVCNVRSRYLWSCLKISDRWDDTTLLLNPEVRDKDGEWEAWNFGAKLPGAIRYRSFYDLMQAQLEAARQYQPEPESGHSIQSVPRPLGSKGPDEPS